MTNQATREFFAVVLCLFAALMIFGHCIGCGSTVSPKDVHAAKEGAAEASYGAALQQCVKDNATAETIDDCADDARKRWRIVETISKDAGADR